MSSDRMALRLLVALSFSGAAAFLVPSVPSPQPVAPQAARARTIAQASVAGISFLDILPDLTSCDTWLISNDRTPSNAKTVNAYMERCLNSGTYACGLHLLDAFMDDAGSAKRLDRRSYVLGIQACCRMGEMTGAIELTERMNSRFNRGDVSADWRLWSPESKVGRKASVEEKAAMAELFALDNDHGRVFETYKSLCDRRGKLPDNQRVYVSLINAFNTLGASSFATNLLQEMRNRFRSVVPRNLVNME